MKEMFQSKDWLAHAPTAATPPVIKTGFTLANKPAARFTPVCPNSERVRRERRGASPANPFEVVLLKEEGEPPPENLAHRLIGFPYRS